MVQDIQQLAKQEKGSINNHFIYYNEITLLKLLSPHTYNK